MISKSYIAVDAENINLLQYEYVENLSNKPLTIPHTIGNAKEIFEKNGIKEEYQKIFLEANLISMFKYHRFRAVEYIIGFVTYLSYDKDGYIYGQHVGRPSTFCVCKGYECTEEDMKRFFSSLKQENLLENYIKSIAETAQFRTSYSRELYEAQLSYYRKKYTKK